MMRLHFGIISVFLLFLVAVIALGSDITGAAVTQFDSKEFGFVWTLFIGCVAMGCISAMAVWFGFMPRE